MTTVAGISDHIGHAEFVTLSIRKGVPAILNRHTYPLVAAGLPSAPYHHEALEKPLSEAQAIVNRTRASVEEHCARALRAVQTGFGVNAIAIQKSPFDRIPDALAAVLASYTMTCAADGMMYREELAAQASKLGMAVFRFPRQTDQILAAANALGCTAARVGSILSDFGQNVGAPWRKEHRQVAGAALRVLAGKEGLRV